MEAQNLFLSIWIPARPFERLVELSKLTDAKLIVTGHSHKPYSRQIRNTWFINPGSVGRSDDGDPRASYAQALGYMTSPTGACHLRGGYAVSLAFFGGTKEIPRFSLLQSPIAIRNMQNTGVLQDSLGVCRFTGFSFAIEPWARIVSGITGYDFSTARLEEIANRIAALERLFNLEAGLNPEEEDVLPSRFRRSR